MVDTAPTNEVLGSKRTQDLIDYMHAGDKPAEDEEAKRAKLATTPDSGSATGVRACPMSAMQSRMRNPTRNFVMCKMFEAEGSCRFGEKCSFAHSEAEITAWSVSIRG